MLILERLNEFLEFYEFLEFLEVNEIDPECVAQYNQVALGFLIAPI